MIATRRSLLRGMVALLAAPLSALGTRKALAAKPSVLSDDKALIAAMRNLDRAGVQHFVVNDALKSRLQAIQVRNNLNLGQDVASLPTDGELRFRGNKIFTRDDLKIMPFDTRSSILERIA